MWDSDEEFGVGPARPVSRRRRWSAAEAGKHVVADFVLLGAGLGGAHAPGEGGFRFLAHSRGSLFGPRGWAVVQEAAATAFLQGSRAPGWDGVSRKALQLRLFPPVHAMAGTGRKGIIDAPGVVMDTGGH